MPILESNLSGLKLKNPVMTASGTFGYGKEYSEFFSLDKLGAVVVKGIAPFESHGNPTPRIAEVSSGMLNAIGLQGPGIDKFLNGRDYMPFLRTTGATVIVNIWGKTLDDYVETARRLEEESEGIAALEINISCPNVKEGGASFGTDINLASEVVSKIREVTSLPLITKLSPNIAAITEFAKAVVDSGSDIVSLINTIPSMAIDIKTRKPKIANISGGLSGPAIKPIALKMVYDTARAVSVPIIGMGGIFTAEDAIEFFIAGASAIAVGTAIFTDPYAPLKIIEGIEAYLDQAGIKEINELIGTLQV
jgi:dihydroorotate dehydrogenase (NAD+) catalytic subunit